MSGIGERIVFLRELNDISQTSLAKKVGLSATTLSKYEKNLREPRADIIVKIADALKTNADYLLCRTADSSPVRDLSWVKLSKEEEQFLRNFRAFSEREKGQIIERMCILREEPSAKS
ncbi:MAG: helix-turn-helix domain-containing protein [Oscillospiraceae bacterium]|nr:helix-turn-helix domain-containing protein [Oscillospiraceae bacterium]